VKDNTRYSKPKRTRETRCFLWLYSTRKVTWHYCKHHTDFWNAD